MGWDTGLADRIRAKGVRVAEVDGWRTRGSSTYTPLLGLWHHTAGPASGSAPSLAVCIYGRPDVPGPLCQVLQSREPNGEDIAYVIAAGKANHGGVGSWRGISGNSKAFGVEVEHTGLTTQPARRHETTARIIAAGMESGSRDARNCCRHAEYAEPPGRKIDFAVAATPWNANGMRSRVSYWIGRTDEGDDDMALDQAYWDRMSRLVDGRLRDPVNLSIITEAVLEKLNKDGFDDETAMASVIRQTLLEMGIRGVNESLNAQKGDDSRGKLEARFVKLETKLPETVRTVMREILGDSAVPGGT